MTDEQINWAITEAIGADPHWKCAKDYCNDLNAMHEALKTLQPDQLWDVAYSLPMETMLGFMATARELAETFLMVIGKWQPTTEESSADHLRDAAKMMEEIQP